MGDLDTFFAKKDKKKVKGRKYDSPDEIAKRLQESEKKLEKEFCRIEPPKKPLDEELAPSSTTSVDRVGNDLHQDEEEWNEFTDDSQKDLTDLKISKLQIEDEDEVGGCGSGEDGEGGFSGGSRSEGVWNKNVELQEVQEEEPVVPSEEKKPVTIGSYVAPHLRNANPSQLPKRSRKSREPPDITNAAAFPSLSNVKNPSSVVVGRKKTETKDIGEKGFENVKHGATKMKAEDFDAPKVISTANKFEALREDS